MRKPLSPFEHATIDAHCAFRGAVPVVMVDLFPPQGLLSGDFLRILEYCREAAGKFAWIIAFEIKGGIATNLGQGRSPVH